MKYLIVGPAWVGDMVMAQTLFKAIKQREPSAHIDVLAPAWTNALLARMPEVEKAIALPVGHGEFKLIQRFKLGRRLAKSHYDQAIVLPNSLKSALVPFFAGIPKRTGWMRECRYGFLNDWRRLDKIQYPLMIERFLALGLPKGPALEKPYPHPHLQVDLASRDVAVKRLGLQADKPIVALCPGAEFGPSKRWPAEYFAELANSLIAQGYAVWLFGSKNDEVIAQAIQTKTHEACVNLCGQTNLAEAIDLLSLAQAVVSNDSGLMHIAAALNVPVVALYGSTSPDFTPPLSDKVAVLKLDLECQPCFQRVCPLGHWRCLRDLQPAKVEAALSALLNLTS
ncbi:MAG: lipopolysaccharide heptosyltransferase II [Gammaproteobacteria bacterium CG11_big_fil_rev_8_21_14_0_20_46_22]|nr:MAG: lipopolysaccharide heptosyltransferase II [Gammaproteobacteria bacterium CG12_big_fil_rev_8_21_14_0_65_46_12]PIR11265.1 MAG: lipopolysaccharide heptosyltransferase II [Gammaproteobacteria bacterium CG11_big_fil_rev_8_21_14_0_20_46_22]